MENETKLKKIIAAYNPFHYRDIDLSVNIKDKYVAAEFKDSLAEDICNAWSTIDCTKLHNDLFSSIKTGDDILEMID